MNSKQRKRERRRLEQLERERQNVAKVQTSAPHEIAAGDHVSVTGVAVPAERSDGNMPIPPRPPRKFGEPRVYRLDSGLKVTIEGDEETLEQEVFISSESDFLEILTGDAAIERRIVKQSGAAPAAPAYQSPRAATPAGPPITGEPPKFLGDRQVEYDGRGPRPKPPDPQDLAMADVGISFDQMAQSMPGVAALRAVPDEVIAP